MAEFETAFDFEPEMTEETTEEVTEEKEEAPTEDYTYKVLDDVKTLTRANVDALASELGYQGADLITALQKGADYDRKSEEAKLYVEHRDSINALKTFADARGIPMSEAANVITDISQKVMMAEEMNAVREEFPDLPLEAAKRMAELRLSNKQQEFVKASADKQAAEQKALDEEMNGFFKNHPEMLQEEMPERFIRLVGDGHPVEEAFAMWKMEEMSKELATLKSAEEKRAKRTSTPGSMKASVGDKGGDSFEQEFSKYF